MATATKLKLHTMMGNYPNTAPLKSGAVKSDLIDYDFAEVKVANNLFKAIVREARYDVAELAIATYLQARAAGKPYILLPAVLVSRGQHHTIGYNPERGALKPSDLNGKRVGVRAYTVTTGTWVRGILASDYGVDLNSVEWVTFEDPHVAEYTDPPAIKRAPEGKEIGKMLLDGEISAAILGDKFPDPRSSNSFPMPKAQPRNGPNVTAAFRSTTWWWCARSCHGHALTWSRKCSGRFMRARRLLGCRTAGRWILIASVSRPAGRSWKSSSTIASSRS